MQTQIHRNRLFVASCLALLVTSLSFGIRAGLLDTWKTEYGLSQSDVSIITSTAFWGFPLAVIIGGFLVDLIGMKRLLVGAFVLHMAGILLTIFATGFTELFISTLFIGLGNGTVEAACNPLVTAIYPEKKTTKLNHFHLWFPGGIFIGTLIVKYLGVVNDTGILTNWQILVGLMLLPTILYGYLFLRLKFPVTERVAAGVSTGEMYRSLANPLFIVMLILMFGTAITELFTGQWIGVLLSTVTDNAILILTISTGIMVLGRGLAEPVVHRFSSTGVLLISAILSAIGLYILGHSSGNMVFAGALIFGLGVCYFWPTMLGFVAEYLPRTGAVGLNLMGGAGMFAVSIYTILMGWFYDNKVQSKLPSGADLARYNSPEATSEMKDALTQAKTAAGPEIINATTIIPVILTIAFAILFLYMRNKKKEVLHTT